MFGVGYTCSMVNTTLAPVWGYLNGQHDCMKGHEFLLIDILYIDEVGAQQAGLILHVAVHGLLSHPRGNHVA